MELIWNRNSVEQPVPVSLSIKNVPDEILERLRARAARNHRSLQKELFAIVEAAAYAEGGLGVSDLADYVREIGLSTAEDTTAWIRDLRDARS